MMERKTFTEHIGFGEDTYILFGIWQPYNTCSFTETSHYLPYMHPNVQKAKQKSHCQMFTHIGQEAITVFPCPIPLRPEGCTEGDVTIDTPMVGGINHTANLFHPKPMSPPSLPEHLPSNSEQFRSVQPIVSGPDQQEPRGDISMSSQV